MFSFESAEVSVRFFCSFMAIAQKVFISVEVWFTMPACESPVFHQTHSVLQHICVLSVGAEELVYI